MPHEAQVLLEYADAERARRVAASVRPEIGDIEGDRTSADLRRDDSEVELLIEAADLVALRAGVNTWLSLVGVAERAGDIDR